MKSEIEGELKTLCEKFATEIRTNSGLGSRGSCLLYFEIDDGKLLYYDLNSGEKAEIADQLRRDALDIENES